MAVVTRRALDPHVPSAAKHPAIDPVCRMTIDSETTRYATNYAGQDFFFCSTGCQTRFQSSPERYARLLLELESASKANLRLEIHHPRKLVVGVPATIEFSVFDRSAMRRISEFEVVHERRMHVLLVRSDLKRFYHVHPIPLPDGFFRLSHTFADAGKYRAFFDFTPATGMNQVMSSDFAVSGGRIKTRASPSEPLLDVDVKVMPNPVRSGQDSYLVFRYRDWAGKPVTKLTPFLGSNGHLIVISKDLGSFIHTHGMTAPPPRGHTVFDLPADMITTSGPTICYRVVFPKPGSYEVWSQVGWCGKVISTPCSVQVIPRDTYAPAK